MSVFKKALDSLKFDKRMIEWNLNKGVLTKEELEKHLKETPDMGANIDLMSMTATSADDTDSLDQKH